MTTEPETILATADAALLVDAVSAASLCGISRSQWFKLTSAGKTPAPVRLGGSVRWNRRELEQWTAAGCPPRERWDAMRGEK